MSDRAGLDVYLDQYPEEEVEREIIRLDELREELALVRRLKALRAHRNGRPQTVIGASPVPDAAPPLETVAHDEPQARPNTRREAIERVMASNATSEWKLSDIREALVKREWLGESDEDNHRLGVTASRMTQREQLVRTRPGYYRLPPNPFLEGFEGREES